MTFREWYGWTYEGVRYLYSPREDGLKIWRRAEDGRSVVLVQEDDPDFPGAASSFLETFPESDQK